MKIIKSDLRNGLMVIKTEVEEDIWYLKKIISEGDEVKSKTMRSQFIERGERKIKTGKKPVVLKIGVEKIEFNEYVYRLRMTGRILEGPDDINLGSYHTIEVSMGDIVSIYKGKWRKYELDILKKSKKKVPKILIIVVDGDESTFGLLGGTGLKIVSHLINPYSRQHEEEKVPEFYKSVAKEINKLSDGLGRVILAGPGFAKEHVKEVIDQKYPDLSKKLTLETVSSSTKSGIVEVIKKGNIEKIIHESEIIKEAQLIEEFFSHLKKEDGLSVYGFDEVRKAEEMGAIDIILVSDKMIREEKMEKLASSAENKGGKVEIISTTHDSGEQFHRMGGLGAMLRFKLY